MDHDRSFERISRSLVLQSESDGQLEIELHRRTLVFTLQCVRQLDVNLGSIERTILGVDRPALTNLLAELVQA